MRSVAIALILLAGGEFAVAQHSISYELPKAAWTSAGLYDAEGRLLRTLWSRERRDAGEQRAEIGDAPEGAVVKVVSHDVEYVWEGVIGNTSTPFSSEGKVKKHRTFDFMNDLAFFPDGEALYVAGYNELQPLGFRMRADAYQEQRAWAEADYRYAFPLLATDDERVYVVQNGGAKKDRFLGAYRRAKGDAYPKWAFADGGWTVGRVTDKRYTGIAVERKGRRLFASIRNSLVWYDKLSGKLIAEAKLPGLRNLETGPDGALYALVGKTLARLRPDDSGSVSVDTLAEGFAAPLALAVSPDGARIVVADGGSSQQLKAFDPSGSALWTYGQEGGYDAHGPDVTTDKFFFETRNDKRFWHARTFVTFSPDGRLWVGDTSNNRVLIFDAKMQYSDQIAYFPHSYSSAVDLNDSSRVFGNWLEFSVDYSKPIEKSWKLVRNWAAGLDEKTYRPGPCGIADVFTIEGRTYAAVRIEGESHSEGMGIHLLPDDGSPMRDLGIRYSLGGGIDARGAIRVWENVKDVQRIIESSIVSTGEDGTPVWGPEEIVATYPREGEGPRYGAFASMSGPRIPRTDSGKIIVFDSDLRRPDGRGFGYHLGAIRAGEDRWEWLASPSGKWEPWRIDESDKKRFGGIDPAGRTGVYDDLSPKVNYGGNRVFARRGQIVYGYHGELWNGGQANQWLHFTEDGLFVGQFGEPTYPWKGGWPGQAGNAFSGVLVEHGGDLYLYHNDESQNAGIHRWRIEGLDTMRAQEIALDPVVNLPQQP